MDDYGKQLEKQQETHDALQSLTDQMETSLTRLMQSIHAPGVEELCGVMNELKTLQGQFAPEKVEVHVDEAADGCPPIGRVIMGGVAVAMTRRTTDGELYLLVENENDDPTMLSIEIQTGASLWRGKVD